MTQKQTLTLGLAVVVISIISEFIGTVEFHLGPGIVLLFPLVWAVILGSLAGLQRFLPLDHTMQTGAARVLEIGIMLFIVRLGTLIGPHIADLANVGYALAFQELGHMFGTVIIALPFAVWLGMGRASIGATYSIDREPNLAYMAERFGGDSDEYRGALSVYLIGSVLGALYVALLAGFLGSAGIFDPIALAMGSGVGSGSMMAAASAAIATEFPAHKEEILAVAGASNLITEVIGVYATVFLSLPLAEKLYPMWERIFRRQPVIAADGVGSAATNASTEGSAHKENTQEPAKPEGTTHPLGWIAQTGVIVGIIMFISNWIHTGTVSVSMALGMILMTLVTIISFAIKGYLPKIPVVVWASLIGIFLTIGDNPVSQTVTHLVGNINFLAMVTPVLAYAGLSIGKDLPVLRKLSWKLFIVAIIVYTATYLSATIIAELLI